MLAKDDRVHDPVFGHGTVIYQGIRNEVGYLLVDFDSPKVGLRAYKWNDLGLLGQFAMTFPDDPLPRWTT